MEKNENLTTQPGEFPQNVIGKKRWKSDKPGEQQV